MVWRIVRGVNDPYLIGGNNMPLFHLSNGHSQETYYTSSKSWKIIQIQKWTVNRSESLDAEIWLPPRMKLPIL
jgi:hypothetical protein